MCGVVEWVGGWGGGECYVWIWFSRVLLRVAAMSGLEDPPLPDELADESDLVGEETPPLLPRRELLGSGKGCTGKAAVVEGGILRASRHGCAKLATVFWPPNVPPSFLHALSGGEQLLGLPH